MKLQTISLTLALLLAALVGWETARCTAADVFREIRIESHPRSWGYAHKTVNPNGQMTGGHLSGGPDAPQAYESNAEITAADLDKLKQFVAALHLEGRRFLTPPDQKQEGYKSIVVIVNDDVAITVHAKWKERFKPKELQAIWDLIKKYNAGAW
jgi:hypothetical protein